MKRIILMLGLLLPYVEVQANEYVPATTPGASHGWEIVTAHQAQRQIYQEVIDANGYSIDELAAIVAPDPDDPDFMPEILPEHVKDMITRQPWGTGRWEGHSGSQGVAVSIFGASETHMQRAYALYWIYDNLTDWAGKVFFGCNQPTTYWTVGLKWSAIKEFSNESAVQAIVEVAGCNSTAGGNWDGAAFTAVTNTTIGPQEAAENTNAFWGSLNRNNGIEKSWTETAVDEAPLLDMASGGDNNKQLSPEVWWVSADSWTGNGFIIGSDPQGELFEFRFDGEIWLLAVFCG